MRLLLSFVKTDMHVFAYSQNTPPASLSSVPEGNVVSKSQSIPATSMYDLSAGLIFPDRDPPVKRSVLIDAVEYSPESEVAFVNLRPRRYAQGGESFEQWTVGAVYGSGEVEFVLQRLPVSLVVERSGEIFYQAARQLLSTPRVRNEERAAFAQAMQAERGELFVVHSSEERVPRSVLNIVFSNTGRAESAREVFQLHKAARARLVAQKADDSRIVSTIGDEHATVATLFDGSIAGTGYVSEFAYRSESETLAVAVSAAGEATLFRKPVGQVSRFTFMSAVIKEMFGRFGIDRFLSEYHLGDVPVGAVDAVMADVTLLRLHRQQVPQQADHSLYFRARHLLRLLKASPEERAKMFVSTQPGKLSIVEK